MKPLFGGARNSGANFILIFLVLATVRLSAATIVVTNATDTGLGSLRDAVAVANPGDTITFANSLVGQAIHLTKGELLLSANLSIDASALSGGMTIDAGQNSRILEIAGGNIALNYLTFTNGSATNVSGAGSSGGAVCVDFGASATLNQCTLCSNVASFGGGLYNAGAATLNGCTLYGNNAINLGGGIENTNSLAMNNCTLSGNFTGNIGGALFVQGSETFNNCTISSNSATFSTGGIYNAGGSAILFTNTIVSGNSNNDLSGPFSGPNDLVGYPNPGLAALGNYGGPTQTMPPLVGSPAIDGGIDLVTNFLATDQRGLPRLVGAHVDIGAAEFQDVNVVITNLDQPFPVAGTLRYATVYAPTGSVITFDPSLSGQTIQLAPGQELGIGKNLTIDASALLRGIQIAGQGAQRVLEISNTVTAVLNSVTLTNGQYDAQVDTGASLILSNGTVCGAIALGVLNQGFFKAYNSAFTGNPVALANSVTGMVNNCTFSGNFGGTGGVVENGGLLTLNNCTLADNSGVALANFANSSGAATLNNCTVVTNSGGGITNAIPGSPVPGSIRLTNTIVAGNGAFDLAALYDGAYNFIGGDPLLSPLSNYGGPTQTMRPTLGSPVIGAGTDSVTNFLATDQRGYPRLSGKHVDIGAVQLQNVVVVNTNDTGSGSLRSAIATSLDAVTFNSSLSGKAIHLTSGELLLSNNLIVDASDLSGGMIIDSGRNSRVLEIAGGNVTLNYLTLTNGFATNFGGGILVDLGASAALNDCTICSNVAEFAGGLFNGGTATLNGCTLFDNVANIVGGGIQNTNLLLMNNCTLSGNFAYNAAGAVYALGSETLNNCTISSNSAASGTGGIYNPAGGPLFLTNTIAAGDMNGDLNGPYSGIADMVNFPYPGLAPLGNYGGPTQTMPPLVGSPAIDAGTDWATNFLASDQRGLPRLVGAHVDIGAAEFQNVNVVLTNLDAPYPFPGSLRYATIYSPTGSVITFAPSLSGQTIQLVPGQELGMGKNLTIDASSLTGGIRIAGQGGPRLLEISNNVTAILNSVTLTNGQYNAQVDPGASLTLSNSTVCGALGLGVLNQGSFTAYSCAFTSNPAVIGNQGIATVNNSTFSGNVPGGGGVVQNSALLTLNNCTLANNSGAGSAIFNIGDSSGATTLNNCTVVGNSGGGISNYVSAPTGPVRLTNTIVAENGGFDVAVIYSGANNFIGGDPELAPLGNYGGPTQTMPPTIDSQVIDDGLDSVTAFLATDQRGFPRLSGDGVDIGAVEAQTAPGDNPPVLKNPARVFNGTGYSFQFNFTNVANADFTALTSTNMALPLDEWTLLGNASQISPGQYQFSDTSATNSAQFYLLISP